MANPRFTFTTQYGEEYTASMTDEQFEDLQSAILTGEDPADITSTLLTGLAAGTNTPIAAGDTILEALANLQAQIDAL